MRVKDTARVVNPLKVIIQLDAEEALCYGMGRVTLNGNSFAFFHPGIILMARTPILDTLLLESYNPARGHVRCDNRKL
ncbi:MAG: hypothetical protein QXQ50_08475 [Candidatus Bathyarchaeia archaeon]